MLISKRKPKNNTSENNINILSWFPWPHNHRYIIKWKKENTMTAPTRCTSYQRGHLLPHLPAEEGFSSVQHSAILVKYERKIHALSICIELVFWIILKANRVSAKKVIAHVYYSLFSQLFMIWGLILYITWMAERKLLSLVTNKMWAYWNVCFVLGYPSGTGLWN